MSRAPRAEFRYLGRRYVALAPWAAQGLELPGYERVEASRAREIFAALPRRFAQHPGVRVMLAGAGGPPLQPDPRGLRLVLYRELALRAQPHAPEPELELEPMQAEPTPPPLLDLRVELAGQAAIAATLLAAAANGAPFCEKCEDCA